MPEGGDLREPCGLTYQQLGKLDDAAVMAHLGAGHGDAIAVFLDRYARLVTSIAYKIVRDHTEAEDVAQEVFVDLYRTAAQFDPTKGTAKMWIIRTAYRRSLTRRRNLKLRGAHFPVGLDEVLDLPQGFDCTLTLKLSSYESQRLVRQILSKLDSAQRVVLEMVFFEGLTLNDVAARTGATLESVRHRYYRSILKLRRMLQDERAREPLVRGETVDAEA